MTITCLYTLHLTPYPNLHSNHKMTRIIHFFASKLAYITQKHYFCIKIYSSNYGTQILSSMWCRIYLSARESRQMPMRRRGTLTCCTCSSGCAIPQPMPLPQVPVGALCISSLCLLSRMVFGYSPPLHLTPYTLYQILRFLPLALPYSSRVKDQRRTKERPKNSQTQKSTFVKIAVSFIFLIPCLIPPREHRPTTERRATQLPNTSKYYLLRLLS